MLRVELHQTVSHDVSYNDFGSHQSLSVQIVSLEQFSTKKTSLVWSGAGLGWALSG